MSEMLMPKILTPEKFMILAIQEIKQYSLAIDEDAQFSYLFEFNGFSTMCLTQTR